jgi:hypothetical protein
MNQSPHNAPNIVLLRGAALWLLMALVLAWCVVGLGLGVPFLKAIFLGKQTRLLQAHIDFLLMTALILGFYAARVPLHWSVRWAMVISAFGNSSLFLLQSIGPPPRKAYCPRSSTSTRWEAHQRRPVDLGRRQSQSSGQLSAARRAMLSSRNDDRPIAQP